MLKVFQIRFITKNMHDERGAFVVNSSNLSLSGKLGSDVSLCIRLSPFSHASLELYDRSARIDQGDQMLRRIVGDNPYTLTRSGREAIRILLREELKLTRDDSVAIVKTFESRNNEYVSSCVTRAIDSVCSWSHGVDDRTKVVLIIHEFGYPYPFEKIEELKKTYPVIEDCAYAFGSSCNSQPVGSVGDYAVYSFSKIFPVEFGGAIVGAKIDGYEMTDAELSVLYNVLNHGSNDLDAIVEQRRENWNVLNEQARVSGLRAFEQLSEGVNPGAYLLDCGDLSAATIPSLKNVRADLESYGVENTVFFPYPALVLPCHQYLGKRALRSLFATVVSVLEDHNIVV